MPGCAAPRQSASCCRGRDRPIVEGMNHNRTTTSRTWLITGASRGFGRAYAATALARGDRVAATIRASDALDGLRERYPDTLLPLTVDVTDRDAVRSGVAVTEERLGPLDVVVNNAGYGHFGAVEELTPTELRDQIETNLFGVLHVTQAVLPRMRSRGVGHIVQVSSIGGIGAFPNVGAYHASKWALEGLSEALAAEVARFGIRVTIVEPAAFGTDWSGPSARHSTPLDAYDPMREEAAARRSGFSVGDPAAAAHALLEIVDAPEPPLRVLFGAQAPELIRGIYERRLAEWEAWGHLARRSHGGAEPAEVSAR